jgi:hypothetical protein
MVAIEKIPTATTKHILICRKNTSRLKSYEEGDE